MVGVWGMVSVCVRTRRRNDGRSFVIVAGVIVDEDFLDEPARLLARVS